MLTLTESAFPKLSTEELAILERLSIRKEYAVGPGGQSGGSSRIENLFGFPTGLSGTDLSLRGVVQMLKFGARLYAPVSIAKIEVAKNLGDYHTILLHCGATVQAKAVLIATGMKWHKLEALNADRFERAGIYYACTSVEAILHDSVDVTAIEGQQFIEAVQIDHLGQQSRLSLSALFVFIGAKPSTDWLPDFIGRDEKGFILTGASVAKSGKWPLQNREPLPLETTIPGILAAGDVRCDSTKCVGFAVGDGSQSVASVHRLLALTV